MCSGAMMPRPPMAWPKAGISPHQPDQGAGDHLEREQDIQQKKIGDLLQGIQFAVRGAREGSRQPLENVAQIVLGLQGYRLRQPFTAGQKLANGGTGQVIEQGQKGVGHQDHRKEVMDGDGIGGPEETQPAGEMDLEAGDDERQHREGHQPMPKPFIGCEEIFPAGVLGMVEALAPGNQAIAGMGRHRQDHAD